jgi:hypothetical protein
MSADSSRERRRLAAELVGTARLITDSKIRASILALAQKWLDLAERGLSEQEAWNGRHVFATFKEKLGKSFERRMICRRTYHTRC